MPEPRSRVGAPAGLGRGRRGTLLWGQAMARRGCLQGQGIGIALQPLLRGVLAANPVSAHHSRVRYSHGKRVPEMQAEMAAPGDSWLWCLLQVWSNPTALTVTLQPGSSEERKENYHLEFILSETIMHAQELCNSFALLSQKLNSF